MPTSLSVSRVRGAVAVTAVISLLSVLVPFTPARAAAREDDPRWSVAPSSVTGPTGQPHFVYDAKPGDKISSFVAVDNLGTQQSTFTVYGTDAFTSPDGAFSLLTLTEPPREVGTWLNLPPRSFPIASGKRAIIPFELTVPENASPGDHAGGVIASLAALQTSPEGQQVYVDRRVAVRVYIRVSGPVTPGATIESFDVKYDGSSNPFAFGSVPATIRIRNSGNIRIDGTAHVRIRGPLGIGLGQSNEIPIPEMLPGAVVTVSTVVSGVAPLGPLDAMVTYNPHSAEGLLPVATKSASLWRSPWAYLVVLALVLAAIVGLVAFLRRRRRALLTVEERELVAAA